MSPRGTPPTVLVTRASEDAGTLCALLESQELRPIPVPTILRVWTMDGICELAQRVPHADDLVLTSAVAARVLATAAPQAWRRARVCAVGPATARVLQQLGYSVDIMPRISTASALVDAVGDMTGRTVVWPHSEQAISGIDQLLTQQGATVHSAVAYRNEPPDDLKQRLLEALPVDVTTLLSGTAAQRVAQFVPPEERSKLGKIVVIGPSTRAVAQQAGLSVTAEATPHSVNGIVRAVKQLLVR